MPNDRKNQNPIACFITNDSSFSNTILTIFEENTNQLSNYMLAIKGDLISMFARVERKFDHTTIKKKSDTHIQIVIQNVINFINEHISEKINISDICKVVNLSPSYLSFCFSQATGKTITEYIIGLRCQTAYRMIKEQNATVGEAAYASGFQNLSYFTRKYREIYGFTPSKTKSKSKD